MNGGPPVPCATYGKIVHIFVKFPPQCGTTSGSNAANLPEVGKGGVNSTVQRGTVHPRPDCILTPVGEAL